MKNLLGKAEEPDQEKSKIRLQRTSLKDEENFLLTSDHLF